MPQCALLVTVCWRVQVAWSRYLVSFQMELADKKCRPSGSPPRDSGYLNLHLRICAFPTHDSGCKFADYFQRCALLWPAHHSCLDSHLTSWPPGNSQVLDTVRLAEVLLASQ